MSKLGREKLIVWLAILATCGGFWALAIWTTITIAKRF